MTKRYDELDETFRRVARGELTPDTVKPIVARYGIYQQRDGAFMARVRVCGGEVPCARLRALADLLEAVGGRAHLTTRQDLQIHDLPAARVAQVVTDCDALGYPFRGGGGNTFRNLVADPESGLARDSAFDVYPYARAVHDAIMACDDAFDLPRKFKVGFFSGPGGTLSAAAQDVGFVARMRGNERGFTVFAGGGMGRVSLAGLCLADFLPAGQAVDMALRAVAVFHAHGDRQNRNQARLRFVRQRVGDAAFAELFRQTPAASVRGGVPAVAEADTCLPPGFAAVAEGFDACGAVRGKPPGQEEGGGRNAPLPEGGDAEGQAFGVWRSLAVTPTRFGDTVRMVRLFVPYGNLTAAQLRYVADLAEGAGSPFVRIMPSQDILLPFVSERAIPCLYGRLSQARNGIDLTCGSLRGHVVTCVGASLCRIGMADAPRIGDRIAAALDAALLPADTPEKRAMLRLALGGIRISGCFNACAGHPAAAIGIGCLLRKIDGEVRAFGRILTGARTADGRVFLSEPVTEEMPEEQLPEAVLERLRRFAADSRNMV